MSEAGHTSRFPLRFSLSGTAGAMLFFCLSLTPSLLPRPWFLQGVISGIVTAIGYLVGVAFAALGRALTGWQPGPPAARRAWLVLAGASAVLVPAFLYWGSHWQSQLHRLMGMDSPSRWGYLGVLVLAAGLFAVFLTVAGALRAASHRMGGFLGRWVPAAAARVAGALAVAVLVLALAQGVVANGLMRMANNSFRALNEETDPDIAPPASEFRSGSAGSHVSWASLGRWGRDFITRGPTVEQLARFNGAPARIPIRVYAGLDSAATPEERADLTVRELERTGAFSRAVLGVITTTGMGWIDRRAIDPLEYMYNGDTALAAMQHSYLPSFLSFLVDRERARAAGRELFNQVYARWSELPPDSRPKLVVVGKSLGAFGALSAFSGIDDIRNRTDGMLLVGPPNASALWREFVAKRDRGSRATLPVFEGGETLRFARVEADLARPPDEWAFPRVVILQNPSDPVLWWSPRLALRSPGWLGEARGRDVLPAMRWYPFVTFWQVTADLVFSLDAPPGYGHNYGTEPVAAWTHILPPPGWTAERTAALRAVVGAQRLAERAEGAAPAVP